ncbi:PriCT-2 domain-containing protein [Glaciecola sp. KUL10]|uniref:PriCT-2 domain-containing protein n=1 Tax=Glaciecola sp. (strain KUL10) TaxID=2161813 RepID=UPI000D785D60|nr:PriCT-2 domain-containing protein [Glaciecola sp. KUL10]GBL02947.1 hypothetical protein KUL10_02200 [Glaciecola sp. KUL10]
MSRDYDPPSIESVEEALSFISADLAREEWVRVLMGVKSEFGDGAFSVCEDWSKKGSTFNKSNFKATWDNIDAAGSTTIKTVFKLAIDNGYEGKKLSDEERKSLALESQKRAKQREKEQATALAKKRKWHKVISKLATTLWNDYTIDIKSNQYLTQKKVSSHGLKAFRTSIVAVMHDNMTTEIIEQPEKIKAFFNNLPTVKEERAFSFLHIKRSELAIPLYDINKKLWQLQIINKTGTKLFLKHGRKSGCFFFIGKVSDSDVIATGEGYATCASVYAAMKWFCVIGFDAGNLNKVAQLFKEKYPDKKHIIINDNDCHENQSPENPKDNPGVFYGNQAANSVGGIAVTPQFEQMADVA